MVERFEVGARLSEASAHSGLVFLAGQVAGDASQDALGQTQQVLQSIDRLLGQAGSTHPSERCKPLVGNTLSYSPCIHFIAIVAQS